MQSNHWQPILEGSLGERALGAVHEIATLLPNPSPAESIDASLFGGTAGLAVLCAYLSRAGLDDNENAVQLMSQAVRAVSSQRMDASLYRGFTGVGWAVAHLQEQLFDSGDEDLNEALDETLLEYLNRSPWTDDYDLIAGLVGFGVYGLERLPRPSALQCLERVVYRLDETAEHNRDGVTWLTRSDLLPEHQRKICPDGHYNLGLAHGVPGVIAFLGEVCAAGVAREQAKPLLDGAVEWLLRQRRTPPAQSSFPHWTGTGIEQGECRLAWCYGDVGVAAGLLTAARCVNEPEWEREALHIARLAAARAPESAGVRDAALCHGAAGLGHIFNRLFQATGESVFREAAQYWFERTLEMRRPGRGIAGFSAFMPEEDGKERWVDDPGIITGAAGIALTLLAAVTDIEPVWDRMLLVSIPVAQSKTPPELRLGPKRTFHPFLLTASRRVLESARFASEHKPTAEGLRQNRKGNQSW